MDSGALTVLAQDDVGGLQVRQTLYNPYIPLNPKSATKRRFLDELGTVRLWPTPFKKNAKEILWKMSALGGIFCVCSGFSHKPRLQGTASQNIYIFAVFYYAYLEI